MDQVGATFSRNHSLSKLWLKIGQERVCKLEDVTLIFYFFLPLSQDPFFFFFFCHLRSQYLAFPRSDLGGSSIL